MRRADAYCPSGLGQCRVVCAGYAGGYLRTIAMPWGIERVVESGVVRADRRVRAGRQWALPRWLLPADRYAARLAALHWAGCWAASWLAPRGGRAARRNHGGRHCRQRAGNLREEANAACKRAGSIAGAQAGGTENSGAAREHAATACGDWRTSTRGTARKTLRLLPHLCRPLVPARGT